MAVYFERKDSLPDSIQRPMVIQWQREEYYKDLGIAPGVPTMKGAYGDPENTGVGYNTIITELGDHSVPKNWAQYLVKRNPGETPGPPIIWSDPQNPEEVEAGYGFIPDDSNEAEETFFYHSDHLGSTSYITDDKGNITQYTAYLPYGELLVDEHSSSEDLAYKFNGKELDEETGLYYYGARYLQPITSVWYGVDPLTEKTPSHSSYSYCLGNPIRLVDSDGRWSWPWERASLIEYRGDGVFGLRMENFSKTTQRNFNIANNDPKCWNIGEIGISTEIGRVSINKYVHKSYTVGRKNPGIDPKDGVINIKRPIAKSTGQEDKRYHKFEPIPVRGSTGAIGAIAILNITMVALDTYMTYSSYWDSEALRKQRSSLLNAMTAVDVHKGLIPQRYQEDNDKLGAIVNGDYILQHPNFL